MVSITDDAAAAYQMALRAAEALKEVHPNHELLRLVSGSERHDLERYERFWDNEKHGDLDTAPQGKLDAITYGLLAKAMERVLQGPVMPKVSVERVPVRLDPDIDVFTVVMEREKPAGVWRHTACDQTQLMSFLKGARGMANMMGGTMMMPDIPKPLERIGESLDIEDDIPF